MPEDERPKPLRSGWARRAFGRLRRPLSPRKHARPEDPVDRSLFEEYVRSFGIFAQPAEARDYITMHWRRFLRTLEVIPEGSGRLLEIGAAPFCMTLLLLARCRHRVEVVNYGSPGTIWLSSATLGEHYEIPCAGINVECEPFPYPDAHFDVVLCAEVIEHLTFCPSWMLYEIHRILRPGGTLVLTTPNAMRLFYRYANARNIFHGLHIADPFSGYGPYGRHNREFTPGELRLLIEGTGFTVATFDVLDLVPRAEAAEDRKYARAVSATLGVSREEQAQWRGEQMIVTARPGRPRALFLPDELYKSTHAIREAQKKFPMIP
jgi:SAM-dependent methyltransferase